MNKNFFTKTQSMWFLSFVLSLAANINLAVADQPEHLFWANDMVQNVAPDKNAYATGTTTSYMRWPNVLGDGNYENYTKCAPFLTLLLMKSYGWTNATFSNWMGSTSPSSDKYFDAINNQNGFTQIDTVSGIQPGDIIAIKYPVGSPVTGHVMIANSIAYARTTSSPVVAGTHQYEIQVLDSSQSAHGPTDTRIMPDGTIDAGVGIGVFRLYADDTDQIVGYTWSTYNSSTYYSVSSRPVVVGRL